MVEAVEDELALRGNEAIIHGRKSAPAGYATYHRRGVAKLTTYHIDAERSTVLIAARSTMGPIAFESQSISGAIEAAVIDGVVDPSRPPTASLEIRLDELRSGNELYDAELRRRIDTQRFPTCQLELRAADQLSGRRYALTGALTFHGTTGEVQGSVEAESPRPGRLLVIGEKTIDIRDFDIAAPSILMLKIYPDVRVQMFLEAAADPNEVSP